MAYLSDFCAFSILSHALCVEIMNVYQLILANIVNMSESFVHFIYWLIFFWGLYIIYNLILCFKNHYLSKLWKVNLRKQYGDWAVVTGCTMGIGRAYANELASRGINIVCIAKGLQDLTDVSAELREKYGIQTEILNVDFLYGENVYSEIKEILRNKNIGILMNNVGVSLRNLKSFDKHTTEELESHISVNMRAATLITRLILPSMIARGRGAIVNMSSFSSLAPMPYLSTYAASKVYIKSLSEAIAYEVKNHKGITIQTVTPFYVSTAMVSFSKAMTKPSWLVPSPDTFAKSLIATLGCTNNTCGYFPHDLLKIAFRFIPSWIYIHMAGISHYYLYAKGSPEGQTSAK